MGHMQHHTVILTSRSMDHLGEAHAKAGEIYDKHSHEGFESLVNLVGNIYLGVVNDYATFTIVPDGSKGDWGESDQSDAARAEFISWLRSECYYNHSTITEDIEGGRLDIDWVEVEYEGGNPGRAQMLQHSGSRDDR